MSLKVVIEVGDLPIGALSDARFLAALMTQGIVDALNRRTLADLVVDSVLSDCDELPPVIGTVKVRRRAA